MIKTRTLNQNIVTILNVLLPCHSCLKCEIIHTLFINQFYRMLNCFIFNHNNCAPDSKQQSILLEHDDVIKWKHFQRYWPFVPGIYRLPVKYPQKGQWGGDLMFFLWSAPEQTVETPVILRCHRAHYEGNVMITGVQGYKAVHLPQRHRWCESVPQRQHLTRGSADSSNSLRMYIISHTICTRLWCAALFCGYITRSQQIHSFTHILQGYITGTRVVIVSQGHG